MYVVPAAVLAGWLMMFGGVIGPVGRGPLLASSIETVPGTLSPAQAEARVQVAQR